VVELFQYSLQPYLLMVQISRIDLTFMWNEVNDKLRGSSYNVSVELYPSVIDCKPLYVAPVQH
jgi:hypothetical protein